MTGKRTTAQAAFTVPLTVLTVLFCVLLIVSNLIEIKTVDMGCLQITAGFIVFPLSYIINDCIVEVYGFGKARLVIWLGFAMSLITSLFLQIAVWLPGSDNWTAQQSMETIYGNVPRIMAASFAAFLCGSMINAYVMAKMKLASAGGRHFSLRAIVSTLFGEGADSLIFFPIAFGGILPANVIVRLMITQALLKTGYEIVILPITVRVVNYLRKIEGGDYNPAPVKSFKWWRINEL